MDAAVPEDVKNVDGFTSYSDAQIEEYHAQNGFAMTVSDLCFCRDYFKMRSTGIRRSRSLK